MLFGHVSASWLPVVESSGRELDIVAIVDSRMNEVFRVSARASEDRRGAFSPVIVFYRVVVDTLSKHVKCAPCVQHHMR